MALVPLAACEGYSHGEGGRIHNYELPPKPSDFGATQPETPGEACVERGSAGLCGDNSVTFCDEMSAEQDLQWGPCLDVFEIACKPGEVFEYCDNGTVECVSYGGVPVVEDLDCWDFPSGNTPLVLRFDDAPVQYSPMSTIGFDIDTIGQCESVDWPMPSTPWLVLDRDQDGFIYDGSELFGSGTRLASGELANNGFEALRELDSNQDGVVSSLDARWAELSVWADGDGDRLGSGLELASVHERGLLRIELDYAVEPLCDARGNCEVEKAAFVFLDASGQERLGEVVDVHLACQ
jgi:hypothetical protein